jgi:dTDP-4-amino-4,6-dideoxygalactose transaminase
VRYDELLAGLPLHTPWQHPNSHSAVHLYVVRLKVDKIRKSHRQVFEEMRLRGIGVNLHYIPVHTHPFYEKLGFKRGDFPQSERYYSEAMSLPIFQTLEDGQQDKVVTALRAVLAE